ncbi:MAG: septum formation initiator family protein [Minisyncoccia bacterium]
MRNFERKATWRRIMESKPALIFFGLLILVFAWSVFRFLGKMAETGRNRETVEEKVIALREKKENLTRDIDSLSTDEGKEKFFRENYGLAQEGEQMIIVVEARDIEKEGEDKQSSGFLSFFRNLFK